MKCRHCGDHLSLELVDLAYAPPSNAYVKLCDVREPEITFPLRVLVCTSCWLVQTEDYNEADNLFDSNYAYFSSTSSSWLAHARKYADIVIKEYSLNQKSFVVELASNDGYLLRNFVERDIPCLGIEPTESTASQSEKVGVPVLKEFFGSSVARSVAQSHGKADLIIGNNVYAHVPDINDFTEGMKALLSEGGVITLEFPHLLELLKHMQFDTIYHEHFSYLSVATVSKIFEKVGLRIFDVEKLKTHGGSVRVFGCHSASKHQSSKRLRAVLEEEAVSGLQSDEAYFGFASEVLKIRDKVRTFFAQCRMENRSVAAYGAAAKGSTLLNFCGIDSLDISAVFDGAHAKQGKAMPGSHIPIMNPSELKNINPDILIILPWNLEKELKTHLRDTLGYNGEIVKLMPKPSVI